MGVAFKSCFSKRPRTHVKFAPKSDSPNIANLETMNMLTAAELMAFAAIQRKESRGAHYRADYPEKDDANFRAPLVISKNGEQISSYQYKI